MFGSLNETLADIAASVILAAGGWFLKHIQINWKGSSRPKISKELKLELCRQIRKLENQLSTLQRRNDRLQALVDRLVKENAELKADRAGLLNSVAALRAKIEKLACK